MNKIEVTKEYIETHFEIENEIKKLQNRLADHNAQAVEIDWKHVGDMKKVLTQLIDINGDGNNE